LLQLHKRRGSDGAAGLTEINRNHDPWFRAALAGINPGRALLAAGHVLSSRAS